MQPDTTYRLSNYAIVITFVLSALISFIFKWGYHEFPVNFMGGDAKDYYSSLVSTFITKDLGHQSADEWYLLKTNSGTVNVHPVGVSVLLLPFFIVALICAKVFGFAVDGYSFPFQLSVAAAAVFYALLGLFFLKKLFKLNLVSDRISALMILLIFFGTNLLNYTLSEAGMSHVYSFSLISIFLYYSCRFIKLSQNSDLMVSGILLGLVLLVRPNNIFVLPVTLIWFRSFDEFKNFFTNLLRNRIFYFSMLLGLAVLSIQGFVWYAQSGSFLQNTYKRDGFYWLDPKIFEMLFGFDGGFFIYTPLCFILLFGLFVLFKESRFSFFAATGTLLVLFYFFSCYWAFTYFDGLGIRVLVDYYALFAFIGGKLFEFLTGREIAFGSTLLLAIVAVAINLVYCYQENRGILLRAGMTYNKWKHVFMRTGPEYMNSLGGSNEQVPYAAVKPVAVLTSSNQQAFNCGGSEYGVTVKFDSLGFDSNRLNVQLECARKETYPNSSRDAFICMALDSPDGKEKKSYVQFRLNETPAKDCCESLQYNYSANLVGDFKAGDKLAVYIWNVKRQPFFVDRFNVKVFNYNYQIN